MRSTALGADAVLARRTAENGGDPAFSISEAYAFTARGDATFAWLHRAFVQRDERIEPEWQGRTPC